MPQTQIDRAQNIKDMIVVRKAADETVTSSTTIQDDDHLFFSAAANSAYLIEALIVHESSSATTPVGTSMTFTAPSGSVGTFSTQVSSATLFGTTVILNANSVQYRAHFVVAYVRTAGTPGNVTFRWAQQSSSSNSNIVKAGSELRIIKVA